MSRAVMESWPAPARVMPRWRVAVTAGTQKTWGFMVRGGDGRSSTLCGEVGRWQEVNLK